MKVLVIGDVHGRKFWRDAVPLINDFDKIIFLGDYVDPYPEDHVEKEESLIDMLNDIISFKKENMDKVVLLFGNHVLHYIYPDFPVSTRYDSSLAPDFNKIFKENLDLFQVTCKIDDVLFSHAGLVPDFLKLVPSVEMKTPDIRLLGIISYRRGGTSFFGSCEWADLTEHIPNGYEIQYDNMFQVFGHTWIKRPLIANTWACLDCERLFTIDTLTHEINEYPVQ